MKKVIHLSILFIVILAILGGILWLSANNNVTIIAPMANNTLDTYRQQFQDKWKQKDDWDQTLFLQNQSIANILSKKYNTVSLNDLNTKEACNIIYEKIFKQWKSASCKKKVIEKYISAINFIKSQDTNAASDPNVQEIETVYRTYIEAYIFAHKSFGLKPSFNGSSWNNFSSYKKEQEDRRNSILNNSDYKKHLSNISDIKNGLNSIPNKLSTACDVFYKSLASEIIHYYGKIENDARTDTQLKSLKNSRNQYKEEYKVNNDLNEFISDFQRDVEYNKQQLNSAQTESSTYR